MEKMLTSSNQYIRPEYLAPLPNTSQRQREFDSKTSPLALLAQTCSAIGADSPNQSKLMANIEKSNKSHKESRDKVSPGSNSSISNGSSDTPKSSFKPYEANVLDRGVRSPRIKSPKSLSHTPQMTTNGRCESNQSATSSRASPSQLRRTPNANSQDRVASPIRASSKEHVNSTIDSPSSGTTKLTDSIKDLSTGSSNRIPISSAPLSSTSSVPPFYGYPGYPMDLMTASALLNSPHHQMLKAAAMNPYFNYSKLKVPGGSDSMICRDPYCTGCALSSHMLNKTSNGCPAGCTQCDHPGSKSYSQALAAAGQSTAAMYAHAQLAALAAASQMPYVCNWIGADTSYCGKRFSTSDELFSHLRNAHTASTAAMSEALLNPGGMPQAHPMFQRTYPTPPLSPLSTARYHPYSKPQILPPSMPPTTLSSLTMPPHPSLAQYFSPYSFYARLGAPSMHP